MSKTAMDLIAGQLLGTAKPPASAAPTSHAKVPATAAKRGLSQPLPIFFGPMLSGRTLFTDEQLTGLTQIVLSHGVQRPGEPTADDSAATLAFIGDVVALVARFGKSPNLAGEGKSDFLAVTDVAQRLTNLREAMITFMSALGIDRSLQEPQSLDQSADAAVWLLMDGEQLLKQHSGFPSQRRAKVNGLLKELVADVDAAIGKLPVDRNARPTRYVTREIATGVAQCFMDRFGKAPCSDFNGVFLQALGDHIGLRFTKPDERAAAARYAV